MGMIRGGPSTKLVNATGQLISFEVSNSNGVCPLRDLPPGRSRSVSLSLIRKRCREQGSPNWPIRVLINGCFHGMHLHPRHHLLKMTRIVFRNKLGSDGSCVLIVEGVAETFVNRFFSCCINWKKRKYTDIAQDSTWTTSIRESGAGDSNITSAPLIIPNNTLKYKYFFGLRFLRLDGVSARFLLLVRQDRWRLKSIHAFPARLLSGGGDGRGIRSYVTNSGAVVESRKRLYRLISLRRRLMFNRLLLFTSAFILVASLHLLVKKHALHPANK